MILQVAKRIANIRFDENRRQESVHRRCAALRNAFSALQECILAADVLY